MKISFVILTWNSADHINNCIESIIYNLGKDEIEYEIIVVDNGSTDSTLDWLKKFSKIYSSFFYFIPMGHNAGTTYSRNVALKRARGEYIAIVDSDIILTSNIFPHLIHFLKNNPIVGLISPKLFYKDGRYQKSTDNFPTFFSKLSRYFFLKSMETSEQTNQVLSEPCCVDYAISAFWLLPAHVIHKVGLLDENIFYAPEDVDYCLRVWKSGFAVVHYPALTAIHDAREISRGFRLNLAFFSHLKGLFYFFAKHRYLFARPAYGERFPLKELCVE